MAEPNEEEVSPFLKLPGEIKNRIYRLVAVRETPIQLTSQPKADESLLRSYPRPPGLMLACRTTYDELREIYYEENTFHFMEYALRPQHLKAFRERAGRSVKKLTSITVTRAYGLAYFGAKVQFTVTGGKAITTSDFSASVVNNPPGSGRSFCGCWLKYVASKWKGSLLDFLENYLRREGTWDGSKAMVDVCPFCRNSFVAARSAKYKDRFAWKPKQVRDGSNGLV